MATTKEIQKQFNELCKDVCLGELSIKEFKEKMDKIATPLNEVSRENNDVVAIDVYSATTCGCEYFYCDLHKVTTPDGYAYFAYRLDLD